MTESYTGIYASPIGLIEVKGTAGAITSLEFVEQARHEERPNAIVEKAIQQLSEYFEGSRREFQLPLSLQGTEFQHLVWQQLSTIPYGQTITYRDLANALGKPSAVRAVGAANGQNPAAVVVPCHRVIGIDGSLTGYGGGLWRKEWLLKHEGAILL